MAQRGMRQQYLENLGTKEKKQPSTYNRAPHIIYSNVCVCTARLNGLHWKFRLYGSERQRTSNDFASNMSTLVISTAFGLLKQDKAWNNKQQFKDLSKYLWQFLRPLPRGVNIPQLRPYPVNYHPLWGSLVKLFQISKAKCSQLSQR